MSLTFDQRVEKLRSLIISFTEEIIQLTYDPPEGSYEDPIGKQFEEIDNMVESFKDKAMTWLCKTNSGVSHEFDADQCGWSIHDYCMYCGDYTWLLGWLRIPLDQVTDKHTLFPGQDNNTWPYRYVRITDEEKEECNKKLLERRNRNNANS